MAKFKDLAIILSLVVLGMFIPFLAAFLVMFGTEFILIFKTFAVLLAFFALELGSVYLYFLVSGRINEKKLKEYQKKNHPSRKE